MIYHKQTIGKIFVTLALTAFLTANMLESPANASVYVVDDAGNTVALQVPAKRIVSLAPSLTELTFAAGAGAHLVAVSAHSDFPMAANKLPQVADFSGVALEALLVLKPDLVVAWKSGNREKDLQRIRELGIPVYAAEVVLMSDVPRALRQIGILAGTTEAAELAASAFAARILSLQQANKSKPKISVFFELGNLPLMTMNRAHAISEAITLCGGINIFADAPTLVFTPSREALVRLQPQAILFAGKNNKAVHRYDGLSAAAESRMYGIDADTILRQGPRFIDGVGEVCDALDRARATIQK